MNGFSFMMPSATPLDPHWLCGKVNRGYKANVDSTHHEEAGGFMSEDHLLGRKAFVNMADAASVDLFDIGIGQ